MELIDLIKKLKALRRSSYGKLARVKKQVVSWAYATDNYFTMTPFERERFSTKRGSIITKARFDKAGGHAHGFDEGHRLVCVEGVRQGKITNERFIHYDDEQGAIEYRFGGGRAPVGLTYFSFDGAYVRQSIKVSKRQVIRDTFHYDEQGRLVKVDTVRGDAEVPERYSMIDRIIYEDDQAVRFEQDWGTGHIEVVHLSPPADAAKLTKQYAARLAEVVEERVANYKLKKDKLAAVALVYGDGQPMDGPYLGVIGEKELGALAQRVKDTRTLLNPTEWEHYDCEGLYLSDPVLDDLGAKLRAAETMMGDIVPALAKKLRGAIAKRCDTGKHFVLAASDLVQNQLQDNLSAANPKGALSALDKLVS